MPIPSPETPHALLAGGGTGGHVYPVLAVAEELLEREWRVTLCGRPASFESAAAQRHGLAFAPLAASPLLGQGAWGRARALGQLTLEAVRGRRLVRRLDVQVVVGAGGYVSAPAVLGAWLARRKTLLLEPNAVPGVANRWLSRCADEAALAWVEAGRSLRCPTHHTGAPIRRAFRDPAPPPAPGPPWRLLVLGGSQGAVQLNQLLPPALARVAPRVQGVSVLHQCGAAHVETTRASYASANGFGYEVVAYLDDVAAAMARSHLVIARAGAITLAELAAAGRPSVLVPLALAGGHQQDNARAAERAGAASVLAGGEAEPQRLGALLEELLRAPGRLAEMADAARRLARPDAAAAVADRVEALFERSAAR